MKEAAEEEATKVAAVKEAVEVMKEVAAAAEVAMKEAEEVIIIITDTRLILYSIFGGRFIKVMAVIEDTVVVEEVIIIISDTRP